MPSSRDLLRDQLVLAAGTLAAAVGGALLLALALRAGPAWVVALVGAYLLVGVAALVVASVRHALAVARLLATPLER